MKIKIKLLQKYLKRKRLGSGDLARLMNVSVIEIEKMLDGKAVGVNTARKFIRYFTADEAQALIDWEAIGKVNPLACDADKEQPDDEDDDDCDNEDGIGELLDEDERYDDSFDEDNEQ
jgi:hypothetical protein